MWSVNHYSGRDNRLAPSRRHAHTDISYVLSSIRESKAGYKQCVSRARRPRHRQPFSRMHYNICVCVCVARTKWNNNHFLIWVKRYDRCRPGPGGATPPNRIQIEINRANITTGGIRNRIKCIYKYSGVYSNNIRASLELGIAETFGPSSSFSAVNNRDRSVDRLSSRTPTR